MTVKTYNKQYIARSFSRSAPTYDQAAALQRDVAQHLLQLIKQLPVEAQNFLDLGSGTGLNTRQLMQQFPNAQCLAIDIAQGMLEYAKLHFPRTNNYWLCADAEQLPLRDECCDFVFSNLMLQWSSNYLHSFAEIKRVLQPKGLIAFSTFGPQSLFEWHNCWQQLGLASPVHPFSSSVELLDALITNHLDIIHFESKTFVRHYPQAIDLLVELKKLGARNALVDQNTGLSSKNALQRALQTYEQQRTAAGLIPASYEIFFIVAGKKHD